MIDTIMYSKVFNAVIAIMFMSIWIGAIVLMIVIDKHRTNFENECDRRGGTVVETLCLKPNAIIMIEGTYGN